MKYKYFIDAGTRNLGITVISDSEAYVFSINFEKKYPKMKELTKAEQDAKKLKIIKQTFDKFVEEFPPQETIYLEGIFVQPKFLHSSELLLKLHGFLICYFIDYDFKYYPPSVIKKSIAGNGNANKEIIKNKLEELYSVTFSNYDQSDSLAVYEMYRQETNQPQPIIRVCEW